MTVVGMTVVDKKHKRGSEYKGNVATSSYLQTWMNANVLYDYMYHIENETLSLFWQQYTKRSL